MVKHFFYAMEMTASYLCIATLEKANSTKWTKRLSKAPKNT